MDLAQGQSIFLDGLGSPTLNADDAALLDLCLNGLDGSIVPPRDNHGFANQPSGFRPQQLAQNVSGMPAPGFQGAVPPAAFGSMSTTYQQANARQPQAFERSAGPPADMLQDPVLAFYLGQGAVSSDRSEASVSRGGADAGPQANMPGAAAQPVTGGRYAAAPQPPAPASVSGSEDLDFEAEMVRGGGGARGRGRGNKSQRQLELARLSQQRFRMRQKHKAKEHKEAVERMGARLRELESRAGDLERENSLLHKMVQLRDPLPARPLGADTSLGRHPHVSARLEQVMCSAYDFSQGVRLDHLREGENVVIPVDELRKMNFTEVRAWFKEYVGVASRLLLDARGDPSSPDGQKASRVAQEFCTIFAALALYNPKLLRAIHGVKLEDSDVIFQGSCCTPSEGVDWTKVEEMLGVTDEQRQHLLFTRRQMFDAVRPVMQRRRELVAQMQASMVDGSGMRQAGRAFVAGSETLDALNQNFSEEHEVLSQFASAASLGIFTAYQGALGTVHTYPWCPDILDYANFLAKKRGEPSPEVLLGGLTLSDRPTVD